MKNVEDKIIGVFQVLNKLDGKFNDEDKEYAMAFASIAAVAIENARLIEEQNKQYNLLQKAIRNYRQHRKPLSNRKNLQQLDSWHRELITK